MLSRSTELDPGDLAACRALLRTGSRSFDAAARLLPAAVRDPAVALYAFCRVADDAIDRDGGGNLPWLRERLALAYAGRPLSDPADRAFAWVVGRFAIPRAIPEALLEGLAWDAEGRGYADLPALRAYAVRVAGTVGVMMALLMAVRDPRALAAAIDLGLAMQLSNIARDVGEDARAGRLYLPLQWLAEAGIDPAAFLADPRHGPALGNVVRRLLAVADVHYRSAMAGVGRLPLACRFGIAAAGLLYAEIGREVARRGCDPISGRAVVPGRQKAWVLARGLPGLAWPPPPFGAPVPEGVFLLDAMPPMVRTVAVTPWWNLAERLRGTIDLFERLEQRQHLQT
jgi:15-cis-phytoene synthase